MPSILALSKKLEVRHRLTYNCIIRAISDLEEWSEDPNFYQVMLDNKSTLTTGL